MVGFSVTATGIQYAPQSKREDTDTRTRGNPTLVLFGVPLKGPLILKRAAEPMHYSVLPSLIVLLYDTKRHGELPGAPIE